MRGIGTVWLSAAFGLWAGAVLADDSLSVAGRQIEVRTSDDGESVLYVDGTKFHVNGVIYLDPEPLQVEGVTVVTGAAGAGGNACNAAPIVIALPEGGPAEFWGPVDSCSYLVPGIDNGRLVFAAEAVPGQAGESWSWNAEYGFAPGPAIGFAATEGWEALEGLAGAHPAEALAIAPVLEALQAGLGDQYPVFAERISELGSGDLVEGGYLGRACVKFTCDEDWAVLYLDRATRGVFAIWHVGGEVTPHMWPEDPHFWPPSAMVALTAAGE